MTTTKRAAALLCAAAVVLSAAAAAPAAGAAPSWQSCPSAGHEFRWYGQSGAVVCVDPAVESNGMNESGIVNGECPEGTHVVTRSEPTASVMPPGSIVRYEASSPGPGGGQYCNSVYVGYQEPEAAPTVRIAAPSKRTYSGDRTQFRVAVSSNTGSPVRVSATGLPPGVSVSQSGTVTGAASRPGTYRVMFTASSRGAVATDPATWTVVLHSLHRLSRPALHAGRAGRTSRVTPGSWSLDSGRARTRVSVSYRWYVGGKPVRGATGSSYRSPKRAHGKTVKVRVTVRRSNTATVTTYTRSRRLR